MVIYCTHHLTEKWKAEKQVVGQEQQWRCLQKDNVNMKGAYRWSNAKLAFLCRFVSSKGTNRGFAMISPSVSIEVQGILC